MYPGFKRKEFRGKLAIAITANFINRNSNAEARVEEISGVAFIFNQKFFKDLNQKTGIDLENIVYYKDETHYFVMTAKKQSLLSKGVLIHVSCMKKISLILQVFLFQRYDIQSDHTIQEYSYIHCFNRYEYNSTNNLQIIYIIHCFGIINISTKNCAL